jgi:hypothetical protein
MMEPTREDWHSLLVERDKLKEALKEALEGWEEYAIEERHDGTQWRIQELRKQFLGD